MNKFNSELFITRHWSSSRNEEEALNNKAGSSSSFKKYYLTYREPPISLNYQIVNRIHVILYLGYVIGFDCQSLHWAQALTKESRMRLAFFMWQFELFTSICLYWILSWRTSLTIKPQRPSLTSFEILRNGLGWFLYLFSVSPDLRPGPWSPNLSSFWF